MNMQVNKTKLFDEVALGIPCAATELYQSTDTVVRMGKRCDPLTQLEYLLDQTHRILQDYVSLQC